MSLATKLILGIMASNGGNSTNVNVNLVGITATTGKGIVGVSGTGVNVVLSGTSANTATNSFQTGTTAVASLSLNNLNSTTAFATPLMTIAHPFADGDIPNGGSVTLNDSNSNPVTVQMDQVALWPSGCVRMAALSFNCAETWSASTSKTYTVGSSATAPNNTPISGTWTGTSTAAIVSAFKAATAFQVRFTGFDAGAATYDIDVNRILTNYNDVIVGWGTSYPRGGYEVTKVGPVCVELHVWEYIRNQSTTKTQGYVRCDLYIKMPAPGGPYIIDGSVSQPNMWNTVPLSSTAEQFGNEQPRFMSVMEIFNSASRVAAVGGPNDLRTVTGISANFNTSTNRYTAANGAFFPQTGVAFSSTGTLPAGNMAAGVVYWPAYLGGGANPVLATAKVIAGTMETGQYRNWSQGLGVGVGDILFNTTNNTWYYYTSPGNTSSSGTGPSGTGSGITDGTATCDCCSLRFTTQGSGTITAYPVYGSFAAAACSFVDQVGNPLWVGAGAFPDIYPGHDFTYLTTKTKFVPPYAPVTTVAPGAAIPLYTDYSPTQAVGGLPAQGIDSSGDGDGDQRIGYVSEWAVCSLFQPTQPKYVRSTIQMALSIMNFPGIYMYDESGGHPFVANNGTNNSGTPYTNFPNLIPAWTANNTPGSFPSAVYARGATWSAWNTSVQNQTGYNSQYYVDNSHFPCTWQIPWLKTGRTIFLEQGLTHANASCFMTYNGSQVLGGYTYQPLIAGFKNSDQLRGFAWAWRTLFQAIYIIPNSHSMYPYLRDVYDDNAKWQALRIPTFPANQQVLGYWPNDVEQGVSGGVGGWAAWMGFFCMHSLNMEDWRGGLTPNEATHHYWGTAADFYAKQWQIWDPALNAGAPNYCATYRTVYGPNTSNWTTAYTDPAVVNTQTYNTGNAQTVAPYPAFPFDNDNSPPFGSTPYFELAAGNHNAFNYYGNMGRMAAKIRTLAKPSDTLVASFLSAFTANIKARTGVSTDGGFTWGYTDGGGSGINPLTFACF